MQRSSKNVWTRIQSGIISTAMLFGMFTASAAGVNAEGESELHTFTATNLTAAADKETIPDGTTVDDQGTGYIVTFGEVTKRTSSSTGEVTSTEVGKNGGSGFTFTVAGTADVSMTVSSTGGSNTSAIGIIDGNGAVIANNEGITEVSTTSKETLTYALEAGTYKVVSPQSEYNRGARVYYIEVNEKAASGEEPEPEDHEWQFTYFGVSVNASRNRLISAGEGIEEDVVLGSATFNEDGSIKDKGGKFVADSPADGGSYYYTVIDPTKKNFYFQADVIVDQLNPAMDGQEGFALMARDAIGGYGESGNWMANLVSVTATKLPTEGVNGGGETKGVIGVRAYTGIKTPEPSEENEIAATRYSWSADGEGNTTIIEQGGTYRVSLEKNDYAYITSEYRINEDGTTGEKIGEYVYYIPAKDSNATSVSSYSELDDPLTYQEADQAYIAMVVARGLNATFRDIVFTTSDWNAEGWHPQPTTYIPLEAEITSPATTTGGTYELVFKANADGTAKIKADADVLEENAEIKANTYYKKVFAMTSPTTTYQVEFTPDPDYVISAFEKLESYDTVTIVKTVTQKTIGDGDTIYVKPDGSPSNGGTSMADAVDIFTAVSYAGPGQTILLASETYDLSNKALTIARGRSGTEEKPITMKTVDDGFATFDFGKTGTGFGAWGDYWYMTHINVCNTVNGKQGMQLAGNHNVLERMNFYNNGTTGLQVSGTSADPFELWPAYNTILNCTSINNADKALEDADGFAAKLTTGEGNVFDGCIAAYNADDGWDLFAKVATGSIGAVTIKNSLTYKNGYLMVAEGSTAKNFTLAPISCDENGTLTFDSGVEMEAGNGNGFKMGGSNMPGGHMLVNSISYNNKAKGIDSNSCPDIKATDCTTYNNGSYNIAMYTNNKTAVTEYAASGVLSYRSGDSYVNIKEQLAAQGQSDSAVYGTRNFYWNPDSRTSANTEGTTVSDDWFVSLDTSVAPERNADGSINMHGLLLLKDDARTTYGTGARGNAWGQKVATIWAVGDSTVSKFADKYYIPREGYGEELASYLDATVYNLGHSGASSKDFTTMSEYTTLMDGSASVPAMGTAEGDQFLIIGFGHNDEKTEDARFTDPNGDYMTEGSFANSLYVNYIKPALDRGVIPVVCTPIARLSKENTRESYNSANGHITSDTVIGDKSYPGGSYPQAILDMVAALQKEGVVIETVDLTAATIDENVALGDDAQWLHSFTGAKYGEDGEKIPTGLDQTHTNMYGARLNAWLIAELAKETAPRLYEYSLNKEKPTYEEYFEGSINSDYVILDYTAPTEEEMNSVSWPQYTDADGTLWRGSVFGDVGGQNKITTDNFNAVLLDDNAGVRVSVANNCGKIASGSDGMFLYYVQLPAGTKFTLSATAEINSYTANNQVSFGLMARDELYIDTYVAATMGDYVAAAVRNQGNIINYGRKSSALIGDTAPATAVLEPGTKVDLKIVGTADGFTLSYGDVTSSAGFDYPVTAIDPDYIYVGFYAVRNCDISFTDIHLEIPTDAEPEYVVTAAVNDEAAGTAEAVKNEDGTWTVTATANEGYQFVNWTDEEGNVIGEDAELTFTPERDITVTAVFAELPPEPFKVTVKANDDAYGTAAAVENEDGTWTVTAAANEGYAFVSWTDEEGNVVSEEAELTFTPDRDITLTAVFEELPTEPFKVTVKSNDEALGTAAAVDNEDGTWTLTATENPNCTFIRWTDEEGKVVSEKAEFILTPVRDIELTAEFVEVFPDPGYTVAVKVNDEAYGTAAAVDNEDGTWTVTATANEGYRFVFWTNGEGETVNGSAEFTLTPDRDIELTAVFEEIQTEPLPAPYTGFRLEDGREIDYTTLKSFWYEEDVLQGDMNDAKNVIGDGTPRGREIYDPKTDGWYWLDACYDGAVAKNKEVWIPYIFQGVEDPEGKWVRYDKYGSMVKGWYANDNGVYYYDQLTGAMLKGTHEINGKTYSFDAITGVLQ